jgi:hypothetical protein
LRVVNVQASDGGAVTFDQNFTGHAHPNVLRYAFVAPGTSITYTFSPADVQNAFHQYAFTNEVAVPEPGAIGVGAVGAGLVLFARRRQK